MFADVTNLFPFHYRRRVEFADTDLAGVAHFSNLLRYAESAEHAALRAIGARLAPSEVPSPATVGWPRVHVAFDFHAPLRLDDEVDIEVVVKARGTKSVTWGLTLRRVDDGVPGLRIASGTVVAVCLGSPTIAKDGKLPTVPIPEAVARLLAPVGDAVDPA